MRGGGPRAGRAGAAPAVADDYARRRRRMVADLAARGIAGAAVLDAFLHVPRHLFVDEALAARAYGEGSLPIGHGQTLSQPFVVARMLEWLAPGRGDKVLEVGTGSGYQAALLRRLGCSVYSIERIPALAQRARANWRRAGVRDVRLRTGDGSVGWPSEAPFAGIVVGAASPSVPPSLLGQLQPGGRLAIPVGGAFGQTLRLLTRTADGARVEEGDSCRFVRLVGAEGFTE